MTSEDLQISLAAIVNVRIVAIGDVMVDRFVYGDVGRVSAEAPVPVLTGRREAVMLGAAGNVARNVAALGGFAALIGVVGDDPPAHEALGLIGAEPNIEGFLIADPFRPTTVKTRFSAGGQQLLRVDSESLTPIDKRVEQRMVRTIADIVPGAAAVLLSDYGKGAVTDAVIDAARNAAKAARIPLIVDSKARGFSRYGPVDIVKPNAIELGRATNLPTVTDEEIERALQAALAACACGAILVTRAARGMSLAVRGEPVRHFSRPTPEVFDTAGAGDTALAVTGLALAAGIELTQAIELALIACGVVVEKSGVATASAVELIDAEFVAQSVAPRSKVVSAPRMAEQAARWRERHYRVGFTNGCFDILHPGHIVYLAQARSWCDRLIVGLNTDRSVRAAKGAGRPVNNLEARATVLSALSSVDLVVPFDEDTPIDLIVAARPALLVKGGDYEIGGVVGADAVRQWDGEVRIARFVDGHSTTATLLKARR